MAAADWVAEKAKGAGESISNVIDNITDKTSSITSNDMFGDDTPDLIRDIVTDSKNGVDKKKESNYIKATNSNVDGIRNITRNGNDNVQQVAAMTTINNYNTVINSTGISDPMTQALR